MNQAITPRLDPSKESRPSPDPGLNAVDAEVRRREQAIDAELAQSFPASDPPSWVQGTLSAPIKDVPKS